MALYTASITTTGPTFGNAYASIVASATRRVYIREIAWFTTSAATGAVSIGVPANNPVGTSTVVGQPRDKTASAEATDLATLAASWSTPPTAPAVLDYRTTLAGAIGQAVILPFARDEMIILPKSGALVLWNHAAAGAGPTLDCWFKWEE